MNCSQSSWYNYFIFYEQPLPRQKMRLGGGGRDVYSSYCGEGVLTQDCRGNPKY